MISEIIPPLIHLCGMILLISSFGILASPQLYSCIRFYALHSFLLAVIIAGVAFESHVEHLLISAAFTLILKTIVIPQLFFRMSRRLGIQKAVESYVNIPFSLFLSVVLVFVSFYVTAPLKVLDPVFSKEFVPISISTIFLGLLMMTTRKKALAQVLGLMLMENGLFLMGMTMTFGMPLLVELGIFFDVLIGVFIMGIFVFKIRGAFEGIDLDELTSLKG